MIDSYSKPEQQEIALRYKGMLENAYRTFSDENKVLIRKAFDLALEAHKKQRRKSGEPYIYHPIAVAKIVADEIGLGATSITAALLHDVVEDTEYTIKDIEKDFGAEIAKIVEGLTKIDNIEAQNVSAQSENYRKLILTLSDDIRVILIKIADRLDNMRTLGSMKPEKQKKIASETIYLYSPIAHRFGLYNIKSELEDLSLKYTDPTSYSYIQNKIKECEEERKQYIDELIEILTDKLKEEGLNFTIKGRPKSIYSIHKKINKNNISFEDLYDLFAVRIIYKSDIKNEKFLAWKVYSIVTDVFRPNPHRLKDWITTPRSTGYESLHTTIIGPDSRWVEVQIRSERMDDIAEKGIAAHYKYKEDFKGSDNIEQWIADIRNLLEDNQDKNTSDFLDEFKLNLYSDEVFVFTPSGELKVLSAGATPLDFAYSIHSKIGDKCLGAKIDRKIVPLNYTLKSGDIIEVITSEAQKPKKDWLDFVATSKAKSRIKSALNAEARKSTEEGKEILARKLRHLKVDFNESELGKIQKYFGIKITSDLFYQIATGIISNQQIKEYVANKNVFNKFIRTIKNPLKRKPSALKLIEKNTGLDLLVFGNDEQKLDYELASCCTSIIPGDDVFGFITVNKGITVHKETCSNAIDLRANYSYRILPSKWIDSNKERDFVVTFKIEGLDRMGMIADITKVISSNLNVNIESFKLDSSKGIFKGEIGLFVKNSIHLKSIVDDLHKVKGIRQIKTI